MPLTSLSFRVAALATALITAPASAILADSPSFLEDIGYVDITPIEADGVKYNMTSKSTSSLIHRILENKGFEVVPSETHTLSESGATIQTYVKPYTPADANDPNNGAHAGAYIVANSGTGHSYIIADARIEESAFPTGATGVSDPSAFSFLPHRIYQTNQSEHYGFSRDMCYVYGDVDASGKPAAPAIMQDDGNLKHLGDIPVGDGKTFVGFFENATNGNHFMNVTSFKPAQDGSLYALASCVQAGVTYTNPKELLASLEVMQQYPSEVIEQTAPQLIPVRN